MTLYLLDLICFRKIHRQRFAFSRSPLGHWEEDIHVLKRWRITGAEMAEIRSGFLVVPDFGPFGPEALALAIQAGTVPLSLEDVTNGTTAKI